LALALALAAGALALAAFLYSSPAPADFPLELAVLAAFALLMLSFVRRALRWRVCLYSAPNKNGCRKAQRLESGCVL